MLNTYILCIREVADCLHITENTACGRVALEKQSRFTVGSSWRCRKGMLDSWIESGRAKNEKAE